MSTERAALAVWLHDKAESTRRAAKEMDALGHTDLAEKLFVEAERLRSAYSRWAASLVDDAKREGREARADEFTPWAAFQAGAALSAEASATRAERLEAENEALRGTLDEITCIADELVEQIHGFAGGTESGDYTANRARLISTTARRALNLEGATDAE